MTEWQLAELMAARLCHDLVGPIGAVANGVELLGDGSAGPDAEVTGLIAVSARQATRRLQWFRVAFGSASGLPSAAMFGETRRLALGLFEDSRVSLDWAAPDAATEALASREAAKFALNMSLVALECLPRGGGVQVRIMPSRASVKVSVAAVGSAARLPEDLQLALRADAPIAELTPKSVPAYLASRLAVQAGSRLDVRTPGDDRVEFAADLPARS
jgi:histidine phosphotransferase ChpT